MPNADASWKVLPHDPVVTLAENLWWVEGSLPGMTLRRTMTVARRSDGRLVIHSAIAMNEAAMKELESWGRPAFLLVPNGWHRLDAPAFKLRYPSIKVLAPKGGVAKVADKVTVDGTFDDYPQDDAVRVEMLHGVKDNEGAMIVRSKDGVTVVLTDAMFNMEKKPGDTMGWLMTSLFGSAPGPRVSRLFKLMAVSDKKALAQDLERYAGTADLQRVIVAHGSVAKGRDASAALRAAATYL
jgi:hypothetical protein